MPIDSNLLYGEMAGSFFLHIAIAIGVSVLISVMPYMPLAKRSLVLIGLITLLSGLAQAGFLAFLQAASCKGVTDYYGIFAGAGIAAIITACMAAIPTFVEPMRLVVSQLFGYHKSLLTPAMERMNTIITNAGKDITHISTVVTPDPLIASATGSTEIAAVQKGGAALSYVEYEAQTFKEIMMGAAYWSAFGGAYGIGIGSLIATKCKATR
jgi:hypothetical protein